MSALLYRLVDQRDEAAGQRDEAREALREVVDAQGPAFLDAMARARRVLSGEKEGAP